MTVLDAHAFRGEAIELRDVFNPTAVRHGRGQADMQLHQEVRTHRDVECLGEMRGLQPRRDAADARDIDLHHAAGTALQVFAEVLEAVERLADGHGQGRGRDRRT